MLVVNGAVEEMGAAVEVEGVVLAGLAGVVVDGVDGEEDGRKMEAYPK